MFSLFGPKSLSDIADYLGANVSGIGDEMLIRAYLERETQSALSACGYLAQCAKEDIESKSDGFPRTLEHVSELMTLRAGKKQGTPRDLAGLRSMLQGPHEQVRPKLAAKLKDEIRKLFKIDVTLYPNADPRIIDFEQARDNYIAQVDEMLG